MKRIITDPSRHAPPGSHLLELVRQPLAGSILLAATILLILVMAACVLAALARPASSSAATVAPPGQVPTASGPQLTDASRAVQTMPRPEGRLAFPAFNPTRRNWDVYVVELRTGRRTLLREQASQPAFSTDGRRVAFRSEDPSYLGLAILNLDTGEVTQWTRFAEDAWPVWSVDIPGWLFFASQRRADRRSRIYGGLADASAEWEFAVDNKPVYGSTPCSLTGNRLLYAGCLAADCGVILAEGDASHGRVVSPDRRDVAPAASPDGQRVAFMSPADGKWVLEVVNIASGQISAVARSEGNEGSPVWSPDGSLLGFVSDRGGRWAIWAVALDPGGVPAADPVRLVDLGDLPSEGWPWLEQRFAWAR